ncbi:anti-apoptotic protein NR13-like [Anguilla anguilla]|uniref:Bcl-2 Bcl-2 homology region 1-3 domain-containing protein n=2 Tax=Anguilla anguilla TaxID=7936 RepID=A0A0E9X8F9_ANGAN|nr:anti-apoptotic protein NR13-like [Anguilla anguilla]
MSSWLWKETLILAEDYIDFCVGNKRTPPSEQAEAMRHLASEMEQKYQCRFHSLLQTFLGACGPEPSTSLKKVMVELVGDGKLNWGRVVSLFTFTGVLARELYSRGEDKDCSRRLAETIADYLGREQQDWLVQNEGWEGFNKFFRRRGEVSQESSMKTALFAAAGVGIAGLTFLLVR